MTLAANTGAHALQRSCRGKTTKNPHRRTMMDFETAIPESGAFLSVPQGEQHHRLRWNGDMDLTRLDAGRIEG
jgi:hypothetical protein